MFRFDLKGRHTSPEDAGARWLVNDRSPAPAEPLPDGAPDPDQEPTLDLNDELAIVRAVSNHPQQPDDPNAVAGMTKHDGVYDFVPSSPADMDMLYEMLAGLETPVVDADSAPGTQTSETSQAATQESQTKDFEDENTPSDATDESSTAPEPERPEPGKDAPARKPTTRATSRRSKSTKDSQPADKDEPRQDALVEGGEQPRKKRKPRKSKRASIPSWDEIMFGGPTPHA